MRQIVRQSVLWAALLFAAVNPSAAEEAAAERWDRGAMVSAANPHASAAAAEMLARGGHAVDAAIAAHVVLGLVEPQSSGLGGSVFMFVYDRASGDRLVYDGRETAPQGATPDMFMVDGEALGFREAWQAGISVGVPGAVAAYERAHTAHGKLSWAEIFQPAIDLARDGFEVSPRMHSLLQRMGRFVELDHSPAAAEYLYPGGELPPVGFLRKNPEYAETLSRIAEEGGDAFYKSDIAAAIAARTRAAPMAGSMTAADVAAYAALVREAICGGYRGGQVCSAPPPSSGIANIMIAGLYERLLDDADADHAERLRVFVDAQRLAYADRDQYIADPGFVDVPVGDLLDPAYLDHRATERFAPAATPVSGNPAAVLGRDSAAYRRGADMTVETAGTSHLSIIDGYGNAVALTASVGAPFGSFRWTRGFLLNNEMSDFARNPEADGRTVANVIAPGKRPRSSMSPTILFGVDDDVLMVTGSPGGNSIIAYTTKSIFGVTDWGLSAQEAADFPNIIARGETVRVEATDDTGRRIAADLAARGYQVHERDGENSGIHVIVVHADRLEGAADKRREGTVEFIAKP